jgi:hypothetical protein
LPPVGCPIGKNTGDKIAGATGTARRPARDYNGHMVRTFEVRVAKVKGCPAGFDGRAWVRELRTLQMATKRRRKPKLLIEHILAEHRADRV